MYKAKHKQLAGKYLALVLQLDDGELDYFLLKSTMAIQVIFGKHSEN